MRRTGWPSAITSGHRAQPHRQSWTISPSFYFDTALSSSAAALPTLLAFAKPGHITFGSDYPFAPVKVSQLFAAGLETYPGLDPTRARRSTAPMR